MISLQQHLPLSAHELSLGTAPDPALCTWRCLMGGRCWLCKGEKEKTDNSVHDFLPGLRCMWQGALAFFTLSSSLLHSGEMACWKTRAKLCYTAVTEFPNAIFCNKISSFSRTISQLEPETTFDNLWIRSRDGYIHFLCMSVECFDVSAKLWQPYYF